MKSRLMTNAELREALANAENTIKSLRCENQKYREKYRAAKKEVHKLRNERNTKAAELDRALFEKRAMAERGKIHA